MRKLFTLFLAVMPILGCTADDHAVIFDMADGGKIEIALSQHPIINFISPDTLQVTTPDNSIDMAIGSVYGWHIETYMPTFAEPTLSETKMYTLGKTLFVSSVVGTATLYDLSGRPLAMKAPNKDGYVVFDMYALPQGVYVLNVNNRAVKLINK